MIRTHMLHDTSPLFPNRRNDNNRSRMFPAPRTANSQ